MNSQACEVRVWKTRTYRGKKRTTHCVRWRVQGVEHHKTFATAKLAESFRLSLIVAANRGEPFNRRSGLPADLTPPSAAVGWFHHASAFVDLKWPHSSPRHRKGLPRAS
jgi:hypothetical protein